MKSNINKPFFFAVENAIEPHVVGVGETIIVFHGYQHFADKQVVFENSQVWPPFF